MFPKSRLRVGMCLVYPQALLVGGALPCSPILACEWEFLLGPPNLACEGGLFLASQTSLARGMLTRDTGALTSLHLALVM